MARCNRRRLHQGDNVGWPGRMELVAEYCSTGRDEFRRAAY